MTGLAYDACTVSVLWRRDLLLFFRQRIRVLGAVVQTLLFWLVFGAGMSPAFRPAGAEQGYLEFFYPGALLMLILFSSIAASMSVIEDRHRGFLQGVLVGPGSRTALAIGKSLGSSTICLVQAALFLGLLPLAGFQPREVLWVELLVVVILTTLALNALGFAFAWVLDSTQAYHLVMSVLLFPLWMLSGAVFPAGGLHPLLAAVVRLNPLSYAVAGLRRALHGGSLPAGAALGASPLTELLVVLGLAVAALCAASVLARRT